MTVRSLAARTTARLAALAVVTAGCLLPARGAEAPATAATQPAAAATAVAAAVPPAAAQGRVAEVRTTTVRNVRLWQWNVAGESMHHGSVSDGLVGTAVSSIVGSGADVAVVNELCAQQFRALQAGLAAAGWPQDAGDFAAFQATSPSVPTACGEEDFGIALFSAAPLGPVDQVTLPADGSGADRGLLCAPLWALPALRFCTTHITTSSAPGPDGRPANVAQLGAVLERLDAYHAAGSTVLIAGDFNAQPDYHRLDDWYAGSVDGPANGGNTGTHRELDDADPAHCPGYGDWTATGPAGSTPPCSRGSATCQPGDAAGCAKIDLAFVREDDLAGPYSADAAAIPTTCPGVPEKPGVYEAGSCSDHRALLGTVLLRVPLGAPGAALSARPVTPARSAG
jgi:endonuclease/exonuclease/phosphatase family metal-dependent hydrolase